jgi:hypothetical protein
LIDVFLIGWWNLEFYFVDTLNMSWATLHRAINLTIKNKPLLKYIQGTFNYIFPKQIMNNYAITQFGQDFFNTSNSLRFLFNFDSKTFIVIYEY